jgi:site-specific DNA-methyltransferase (adenine-specific)
MDEFKPKKYKYGENMLFCGDNLEIMRKYIPSESVDLACCDPPFCSNRNYYTNFEKKSSK